MCLLIYRFTRFCCLEERYKSINRFIMFYFYFGRQTCVCEIEPCVIMRDKKFWYTNRNIGKQYIFEKLDEHVERSRSAEVEGRDTKWAQCDHFFAWYICKLMGVCTIYFLADYVWVQSLEPMIDVYQTIDNDRMIIMWSRSRVFDIFTFSDNMRAMNPNAIMHFPMLLNVCV